MTNTEFTFDKNFIAACRAAEIPATRRQASKYRNKKGKAWKTQHRRSS
jgi:hypothetical protein